MDLTYKEYINFKADFLTYNQYNKRNLDKIECENI
jgi:hypothetical protein